jgi:sterol desaturase/sphingolipid hydroxylase (fatty acid hydroxylase superfamily)
MIPVKGKHLDVLSTQDQIFININKLFTLMFSYHLILACHYFDSINRSWHEISLANTVGSLIAYYAFYDFFYVLFHRTLHLRSLYPYIHKHHHRQKAPSRGNLDAINVHPFEFIVGEYLHLIAIYLIPGHLLAVASFIGAGAVMAALNHTRYDISIPGLYCVKVHDVHHRLPESNYGQYTMFWDRFFGSYRAYDSVKGEDDSK